MPLAARDSRNTIRGTVHEIHRKKWKVDIEVYANEILSARGEVVAVIMPNTFMNKVE